MRILFSSLPSHGHTYPLIPLARAAAEAGNEVLFATGEEFHPGLRAAGLEPVTAGMSIGEGFVAAYGGPFAPKDLSPEQVREILPRAFGAELPRKFVADLAPVIEDFGVELVVHEAANHGAGIAAIGAGVPRVRPRVHRGVTRLRPRSAWLRGRVRDRVAGGRAAHHGAFVPRCVPAFLAGSRIRGRARADPVTPSGLRRAWAASRRRGRARLRATAGVSDPGYRVRHRRGFAVGHRRVGHAGGRRAHRDWPFGAARGAGRGSGERVAALLAASSGPVRACRSGGPAWWFRYHPGHARRGPAATVPAPGCRPVQQRGGEQLAAAEINVETVATTAKALLAEQDYRRRATALADEIAAMPTPAQVASQLPEFVR